MLSRGASAPSRFASQRPGFNGEVVEEDAGTFKLPPSRADQHEPSHGYLLGEGDLELRGPEVRVDERPGRRRRVDVLEQGPVEERRELEVAADERADLHGQAGRRDVDADVAPLRALGELRGDVDLVVRVRPAHRARGARDDGDAAVGVRRR